MTAAKESWRAIAGHEGLYEVSDRGRVRSLDRVDRLGRLRKGRILRPIPFNSTGHVIVNLYSGEGRSTRLVHHLVLEAFEGPRPDGTETRHLNDVGDDNRLANLKWGSRSENMRDSVRNRRHPESRRSHCDKGHAYSPDNTAITSRGARRCKSCRRDAYQANRDQLLAKARETYRADPAKAIAKNRAYRARKRTGV